MESEKNTEGPDTKRVKLDESGQTRKRPECPYGVKCYRRNVGHLLYNSHSKLEEIYGLMLESADFSKIPEGFVDEITDTEAVIEQVKVLKNAGFKLMSTSPTKPSTSFSNVTATSSNGILKRKTMAEKWEASLPFNFFLTKVPRLPNEPNSRLQSITFLDLFDKSLGEVRNVCHINFMIEAGWLMDQIMSAGVDGKPTWIICGVESVELQNAAKAFPWLKLYGIKSPFSYGSHHAKMALIQYTDDSMRFVVHTANLIDSDWDDRTQGVWISPKCPKLESSDTSGNSKTNFKSDFIQYLKTYPVAVTAPWIDFVKRVDCSAIKVYFIASTPTKSMTNGFEWGTKRISRVLSSLDRATTDEEEAQWPLNIQCSSLGSFGIGPQDWIQEEVCPSFPIGGRVKKNTKIPFNVIYPSFSNVKASLDGLRGGGCLPYTTMVHRKQTWLQNFLCQWKADSSNRTRAIPHIKSYCRISPDNSKMSWFLLTSANMSNAAWGKLNKARDKLNIMSWEAGILFTPQMFISSDSFSLDQSNNQSFPFPYDLPLTKYQSTDKPFLIDFVSM